MERDFRENVQHIIADLQRLPSTNTWGKGKVVIGDSTSIHKLVSEKIDRVITSPPYPNRFSYVHTTRPQLFFMDLFNSANESSELDCLAIGGTWGKATSVLYEGVVEPKPHLIEAMRDIVTTLRPRSNLMCNYAVKYFNMMDEHIESLKKSVAKGFKGAYVVGNSRLKGVEILTEVILARSFEFHGFDVDKVLIFRKRGGKKKLYETAICVSA